MHILVNAFGQSMFRDRLFIGKAWLAVWRIAQHGGINQRGAGVSGAAMTPAAAQLARQQARISAWRNRGIGGKHQTSSHRRR